MSPVMMSQPMPMPHERLNINRPTRLTGPNDLGLLLDLQIQCFQLILHLTDLSQAFADDTFLLVFALLANLQQCFEPEFETLGHVLCSRHLPRAALSFKLATGFINLLC